MFNRLIARFTDWLVPQTFLDTFSNGDQNMFAQITPLNNGKFAITDRTGSTVATYARARDARRGAERRGFVVAA